MVDPDRSGAPDAARFPGARVFWILLVVGVVLAVSPIGQEPHLLQKLTLLWNGWLHKPLDWFDLALHSVPLLVALGYGVWLLLQRRKR